MGEVIAAMRQYQYSFPSPYQASAIKRYEEIHCDYHQEYKHTAVRYMHDNLAYAVVVGGSQAREHGAVSE